MKSLFAGQPEDTMTEMWAKWAKRQEKKKKTQKSKLNRKELNKILEDAKAEFKQAQEKSKAALQNKADAGFEKELTKAASLLMPELPEVRIMPEICIEPEIPAE